LTTITLGDLAISVTFGFALIGIALVLAEAWFRFVTYPAMRRRWKLEEMDLVEIPRNFFETTK